MDSTAYVRCEPGRCGTFRDGHYQAYLAEWAQKRVTVRIWGRRVAWDLAVDNDGSGMTVVVDGKTERYRRLAAVPPQLEPKPLDLGEAKPLAAERVTAIQDELKRRRDADQTARKSQVPAAECEKIDTDNTAWLRQLVVELGWIDADRFGGDSANAAFLLVQHSGDLPLMLAALPHVESDVQRHLVSAQDYALLFDRSRVVLGEKQRYGTQLGRADSGWYVVMPLEDRAHVNDLRQTIGLFSLEDYFKFMKEHTSVKEVRFDDEG